MKLKEGKPEILQSNSSGMEGVFPVSQSEEEYEEERGYYTKTGKITAMAHADNAGYNGSYNLFLRLKEGWVLFESTTSKELLLNHLSREKNCPLYNNSSLTWGRDPLCGVWYKMYGNWFSRTTVKEWIQGVIGNYKSSTLSKIGGGEHLLLKKIYHSYFERLIYPEFKKVQSSPVGTGTVPLHPLPGLGHSTVVVGRYERGLLFFPSQYRTISRILSMGGGSLKKNETITRDILGLLGLKEQDYEDSGELLSLAQLNGKIPSPVNPAFNLTFLPDEGQPYSMRGLSLDSKSPSL